MDHSFLRTDKRKHGEKQNYSIKASQFLMLLSQTKYPGFSMREIKRQQSDIYKGAN